jgi:antitoxin component of MazEF toxin-antitoxin module
LKLRQAGGSIGATLPKDMAERLHLSAGDTVLADETDRGILLTPYDPLTEEALAIAGAVSGNKRIVFVTMGVFLGVNACEIDVRDRRA